MAQTDIFLKIEGVPGESGDEKHKGEIELAGFSWDAENATTIGSATGGAGAGKIKFKPFTCRKRYDKSSPLLFANLSAGQHFKEVKLTVRKAGAVQVEYLIWKMSIVFLVKYSASADDGSPGIVYEHVEFVFGKMEMEYREQKADGSLGGSVKQGWDQVTNTKV